MSLYLDSAVHTYGSGEQGPRDVRRRGAVLGLSEDGVHEQRAARALRQRAPHAHQRALKHIRVYIFV